MALIQTQVKHVAKLANLPLSSEEEDLYTKQLSGVLDYIEKLNEVDTTEVNPTFNVTGLANVMREDTVAESLSQEKATKNGSKIRDGYFVTKGVFDE